MCACAGEAWRKIAAYASSPINNTSWSARDSYEVIACTKGLRAVVDSYSGVCSYIDIHRSCACTTIGSRASNRVAATCLNGKGHSIRNIVIPSIAACTTRSQGNRFSGAGTCLRGCNVYSRSLEYCNSHGIIDRTIIGI